MTRNKSSVPLGRTNTRPSSPILSSTLAIISLIFSLSKAAFLSVTRTLTNSCG